MGFRSLGPRTGMLGGCPLGPLPPWGAGEPGPPVHRVFPRVKTSQRFPPTWFRGALPTPLWKYHRAASRRPGPGLPGPAPRLPALGTFRASPGLPQDVARLPGTVPVPPTRASGTAGPPAPRAPGPRQTRDVRPLPFATGSARCCDHQTVPGEHPADAARGNPLCRVLGWMSPPHTPGPAPSAGAKPLVTHRLVQNSTRPPRQGRGSSPPGSASGPGTPTCLSLPCLLDLAGRATPSVPTLLGSRGFQDTPVHSPSRSSPG